MIYTGKMAASMVSKVRYCPVCPACKPGFVFVLGRAKAIHNCSLKELKEWLRVHKTLEDAPLPLTGRRHELVAIVGDCVDRGVKHAGIHGHQKPFPNSSPSSSPSLPSSKAHEERPVSSRQRHSFSECSVSAKVESSLTGPDPWHSSDDDADTYDTGRYTTPVKQGVCV